MSNTKPEEDIGYSQSTSDSILKKVGLKPVYIHHNAVRLQLLHLNVGMFDTQGKRLIVCYLMRLLQQPSWFLPVYSTNPDENLVCYTRNYRLDINKSLYRSNAFTYPLILDHAVNYVKRTSKRCTLQLKQSDLSPDLAIATSVEVNIDPVSKRPKPYPVWWKKKLNLPKDGPQLVIQPVSKPTSELILSDKRKIFFTDTDENNHTDYITYITMCLDSFYYNVLHDKYPRAKKVFLNGWVKTLTVIYKGDSRLDDVLTIDSWEDSNRQNTYHFEISNSIKAVVNVSLEFYTVITMPSKL